MGQLLAARPGAFDPYFYRTAGGAEVDLVLRFRSGESWFVEVKRSLSPSPSKGFNTAAADLEPSRQFIVYPGRESFPLSREISVMGVRELVELIHDAS